MKPLPVLGYTDQTDVDVDVVNENKALEEVVLRRLDEFAKHPDVDQRCISLSRTKLQEAFMWMNRGIFKPTRVEDDKEIAFHIEAILDSYGLKTNA